MKLLAIISFAFIYSFFHLNYSTIAENHEKKIDTIPQIYMPEYFNQFGYIHGRLAFSPDGDEAFWVITTSQLEKRLIITKLNDTTWSAPENSFLNVDFKETSPCYSPDGQRVYYQSRFNKEDESNLKDLDIFYHERTGNGWSEPTNIGLPVNTTADEGRPWIENNGTLWFTRNTESTKSDIYFSEFENGKLTEPTKLPEIINSEFDDTEPVISPEGSYLLFISNRPNGYSHMMNLYICFRCENKKWTAPICLSNYLKIENIWFPSLTFDGKYLFFCGGYPSKSGYNNSNYYLIKTDFILQLQD